MRLFNLLTFTAFAAGFCVHSVKNIHTRGQHLKVRGTLPSYEIYANASELSVADPLTTNDRLTVHFYGPVTEANCLELTQTLHALDLKAKHQKVLNNELNPYISLHIQSGGGSLMPTFFVCDTIKSLDTPVHTYVDGYCASAASLISVCGKRRYMTKHSAILIHQLSSAASGKFNEMKTEMDNLNFFMNHVRDIYLSNTDIEESKLDELLATDIWLDAKTCLNYKMIDGIL